MAGECSRPLVLTHTVVQDLVVAFSHSAFTATFMDSIAEEDLSSEMRISVD
jgi:hypothetical protein